MAGEHVFEIHLQGPKYKSPIFNVLKTEMFDYFMH